MLRALFVATVILLLPQRHAEAEAVSVRLAPRESPNLSGSVLVIRAAEGEGDVTEVAVPVARSVGVSVPLPDSGHALITCRGLHLWCPEIRIDASKVAAGVELPAFPAAQLVARLVPPAGYEPPARLTLQAILQGEPSVRVRQQLIVRNGRIAVTVPKTTLDLRVAGDHFMPIYRFGLSMLKGDRTDLGTLLLVPGSSVVGSVVQSVTPQLVRDALVRLMPTGPLAYSGRQSELDSERLKLQAAATRTDRSGHFQISGVSPGRYTIEIRSPLHPALLLPIDVPADAEADVGEVTLKPFLRLEVTISPSVDPDGRPWKVAVVARREQPSNASSVRFVATLDGKATFSRLEPGQHSIEVQSESAGRALWQIEDLTDDRSISLDVQTASIKGHVRTGDTAVPNATVIVETGSGDRAQFRTDEAGDFGGFIRRPTEDQLDFEVQAPDWPTARMAHVDKLETRDGVLFVDVNLGDQRLSGIVINESGAPVLNAQVSVKGRAEAYGDTAMTLSNTEGRFEFPTLRKGDYLVAAKHRTLGASDLLDVNLAAGPVETDVTLRLRPGRLVKGIVLSATDQVVPNAEVVLLADGGGRERVRTDSVGRFEARLQSSARFLVAQVLAVSQVMWSGCVRMPAENEELNVRLPVGPGGTLTLPALPSRKDRRGQRLLIVTDGGGFFGLAELVRWRQLVAGSVAEPISLPAVAAGRYAVLWTDKDDSQLVTEFCYAGPPAQLGWDSLRQGGALSVSY